MKYGYSDASWKRNKLFLRKKDTKVFLIPHEEYKGMYWIKWSDGAIEDFYNLVRAKDNSIRCTITEWNKDLGHDLEGRTQTR